MAGSTCTRIKDGNLRGLSLFTLYIIKNQNIERNNESGARGILDDEEDTESCSSNSSSSGNVTSSSSSAQRPVYSPLTSELSSDSECREGHLTNDQAAVSISKEVKEFQVPSGNLCHNLVILCRARSCTGIQACRR